MPQSGSQLAGRSSVTNVPDELAWAEATGWTPQQTAALLAASPAHRSAPAYRPQSAPAHRPAPLFMLRSPSAPTAALAGSGSSMELAPNGRKRLGRPASAGAMRMHLAARDRVTAPRRKDLLGGPTTRDVVRQQRDERALAHRLEEVSAQIPRLVAVIRSRNECISTLQAELTTTRHALEVANSRIWQPRARPAGSESTGPGPLRVCRVSISVPR